MIVVFDTNIWIANLYLKSPVSAALRYFLQVHDAKVGLPEVVRLEVESHLRSDIYESRDEIEKKHDNLLRLFGWLHKLVLPTESEIEDLVTNFFSRSGFNLQDVPFSLESARDSFLRTVNKAPPSHKAQQFKDGLIWKDCMILADAEEVVLVTNDRGFYEKDKIENGLAKILEAEAKQCRYKLRVLPKLTDLLEELERPIEVDEVVFEKAVSGYLRKYIDEILERSQFALVPHWRFKKSFFATQNHGSLYVEFVAETECEDIGGEGRTNSILRVSADGLYILKDKTLSNVQPRELVITYKSPDGRLGNATSTFANASIVLGHPIVTHIVRVPLDVSE